MRVYQVDKLERMVVLFMSYMYYDVLGLIKKTYKDEFRKSKKEIFFLITYFLGALSAIFVPMLLSSFKETSFVRKILKLKLYGTVGLGAILLGGCVAVYSLWKVSKMSKKHNTREHVIKVKKALEESGINNREKIDMLKEEIKIQNQKDDDLVEEIKKMIAGIFKTILIVPVGFLFGMLFQNTEKISFEGVISISSLLLVVSVMIIGITLITYPSIKQLLFISRNDRNIVYRYLCDIEYLDD